MLQMCTFTLGATGLSSEYPTFIQTPCLLGVGAAVGLADLDRASSQSQASLATTGLADASVDPDTPSAIAGGAGNEASATELQVAIAVNSPSLALPSSGDLLHIRGVAKLSLAHSGAVDEELLRGRAFVVQEQIAVNQLERSQVICRSFAGSPLLRHLEHDVVVGGLEAGEMDARGGAQSKHLEGVRCGGSGGHQAGGHEGSEEDVLDLHCEGFWCCEVLIARLKGCFGVDC